MGFGLHCLGELDQDHGVDVIGLGKLPQGTDIILHLAGVNQGYRKAGCIKDLN